MMFIGRDYRDSMKYQVVMERAKELERLFSVLEDDEVVDIVETAGVKFEDTKTVGRVDCLNVAIEADPDIIRRLYIKKLTDKLDRALAELAKKG